MVWNKSGEERIKSYRIYRELEDKYNELVLENARLVSALAAKDDLIRSLAAEVAQLPSVVVPAPPKSGLTDIPPPQSEGQRTISRRASGTHTLNLNPTGDEELDAIPIPQGRRG